MRKPWIKMREYKLMIKRGSKIWLLIPQISKYIPGFRVNCSVTRPHLCAIQYNYLSIEKIWILDCTFVTGVNALGYFRHHAQVTWMLDYNPPGILDVLRIRTLLNQLVGLDDLELIVLDDWVAKYSAVEVIFRLVGEGYVAEWVPEVPNVRKDCVWDWNPVK